MVTIVHQEHFEKHFEQINFSLEMPDSQVGHSEIEINTTGNNMHTFSCVESNSGVVERDQQPSKAPLTNLVVEGTNSISSSPCRGGGPSPPAATDVLLEPAIGPILNSEATDMIVNTPSFHKAVSPTISTLPPLQRPTYQKCYQKVATWTVKVTKAVLIVGDSNLARIPAFNYPLAQINSYLGEQIHHLMEVMQKHSTGSKCAQGSVVHALRHNHTDTI